MNELELKNINVDFKNKFDNLSGIKSIVIDFGTSDPKTSFKTLLLIPSTDIRFEKILALCKEFVHQEF